MDIYAKLTPSDGKRLKDALSVLLEQRTTGRPGFGFLTGGAMRLVGAMSDKTVNALLDRYKKQASDRLGRLLKKKGITVKPEITGIVKVGEELLVTARCDDTDGFRALVPYLPAMIASRKKRNPGSLTVALAEALGDESESAANAVWDVLGADAKQRLLRVMAEHEQAAICEKATKALKSHGLDLSVTQLNVE